MSASDDALENRVRVLEREFARFREQAALTRSDAVAARVLAAGADHDVSEVRAELRAHTQALNALRDTQLELRETQLEQGQRMSQGFSMVNTGMAQITALLTGMSVIKDRYTNRELSATTSQASPDG
ncbi:MAG: hypothetical protein ACRDRH_03560 [Pseudonocardia sp.]